MSNVTPIETQNEIQQKSLEAFNRFLLESQEGRAIPASEEIQDSTIDVVKRASQVNYLAFISQMQRNSVRMSAAFESFLVSMFGNLDALDQRTLDRRFYMFMELMKEYNRLLEKGQEIDIASKTKSSMANERNQSLILVNNSQLNLTDAKQIEQVEVNAREATKNLKEMMNLHFINKLKEIKEESSAKIPPQENTDAVQSD